MKNWYVRRAKNAVKHYKAGKSFVINSFKNSIFINSQITIAETIEVKGENMNEVITENPLKAEAFDALNQIFQTEDETLIRYAVIQLKSLMNKSPDKKGEMLSTQKITDSDHPAENLHCLRSMIEFIKASAIGIACDDGKLKRAEWDGFISMLTIISNDMKAIADNL